MQNTRLDIRHPNEALLKHVSASANPREALVRIAQYLEGMAGGVVSGIADVYTGSTTAAAPAPAVAHLDLATCTADTVIEINGAPFTAIAGTVVAGNDEFDIDGTDAADAADLARAINASSHASISGVVRAINPLKDKLTAATAIAGTSFTVTLADSRPHRFVGKAGAATAGAKNFSIDTGNTETATSIAAQINGYTPFAGKLSATSALAVVALRSVNGETFTLTGTATVLAESGGATVTLSPVIDGVLGNGITVKTLGVVAKAIVTVAAIAANDTITINGQVLTSKQQRGTGTLTAAAAAAADTFSINGYTFTGRAGASTVGQKHFSIDTGNNETATDIAAQINGFALLSGIVTATAASAVVTIRAVTAGTAGNAITLTGTAVRLAASAATLTGGIAVAVNEFEAIGTNAQIATDMVRAIHASTTAIVSDHVRATANAAAVTVWAKTPGLPGNAVTIASSNGTRLAITGSAARLAGAVGGFEGVQATGTVTISGGSGNYTITINGVNATGTVAFNTSDTQTGADLADAINKSTNALVQGQVNATAASGVVTITAIKGGASGNAITLACTGTGATASGTRLASGAAPTTVVASAARLSGGVGGGYTSQVRFER